MRKLTETEELLVELFDDMYLFDCESCGLYAWKEVDLSTCPTCKKQGVPFIMGGDA